MGSPFSRFENDEKLRCERVGRSRLIGHEPYDFEGEPHESSTYPKKAVSRMKLPAQTIKSAKCLRKVIEEGVSRVVTWG
jgi:hypothetical protein